MIPNLVPRVFHLAIKDSGNKVDGTSCDAYKKKPESYCAAVLNMYLVKLWAATRLFETGSLVNERNNVMQLKYSSKHFLPSLHIIPVKPTGQTHV